MTLKDKTIVITGSSRGIGREIALKCAKDGANIVIIGKTETPHKKLEGTIHSVCKEVEVLGGNALPIALDLRNIKQFDDCIQKIINRFGTINALINNASALFLNPIEKTPLKKFELILDVNTKGTFFFTQACLKYLKKGYMSDVITISPPLNMTSKEFKNNLAYTISKYNMSMITLGLSKKYKKIRFNSLWPAKTVATAAVKYQLPKPVYLASRKPSIMSDAAYSILTNPNKSHTGNLYTDEDLLKTNGVSSFKQYKQVSWLPTINDIFLD